MRQGASANTSFAVDRFRAHSAAIGEGGGVVGGVVDLGTGPLMTACPIDRPTVTLSTYAEVREAMRAKDLRQALYDDLAWSPHYTTARTPSNN